MTYHDTNRLQAHLEQPLPSGTRYVARFVAEALNNKTGTIQFSADYISRQTGLSRKTIEKHLSILENLGIFTSNRKGERQARIWELNIQCPLGCRHLKSHNTPARLARLEQSRVVDNPDQMSNSGDQMSKNLPTNKTKDIKIDDIEIQFSNLGLGEFITWTISQLPELNEHHNSLLEFLETNKAEVEAKALAILKKRTPARKGKYLAKVVTDTPTELFKKLITAKAKASSKVVATIHSSTIKPRVTFSKVKGYCSKQLGFELTEVTRYYLGKKFDRGLEITWKDLVICELIEKHNLKQRAEGTLPLGTDFDLWLTQEGKPKLHLSGNGFTSEITTATDHLEYLNQQLIELYERLPDQTTLEAYDLENWLLNNYSVTDDRNEFLAAYPTPAKESNWDLIKVEEELLLAYQRGLSLDELIARATALPRNLENWAYHKQYPNTWLREQQTSNLTLVTA